VYGRSRRPAAGSCRTRAPADLDAKAGLVRSLRRIDLQDVDGADAGRAATVRRSARALPESAEQQPPASAAIASANAARSYCLLTGRVGACTSGRRSRPLARKRDGYRNGASYLSCHTLTILCGTTTPSWALCHQAPVFTSSSAKTAVSISRLCSSRDWTSARFFGH